MPPHQQEPNGWLVIAVKFGIPALIAVYLVYILAGDVRAGIRDNTAELNQLNKSLTVHNLGMENQWVELSNLMRKLHVVAQEQCINGAIMAERSPKECLK